LTKWPGKRMKELAMRMEWLPSSMVVHKRVATLDTRLAEMGGELVSNPLERSLGFCDFGRYTKAADDAGFAFEKMNDLWDEELETELNSEDETEEEEATGTKVKTETQQWKRKENRRKKH
jgi:hypothetical protein